MLFPLLAASTTLGDIAGGFLVKLLGLILASYQTYGLSVINMIVVIALMRPLVRRYFVAPTGAGGEEEAASLPENLRYFGRSTYLKLLFVLSIAIFALYTAIHYAFNVIARQHYASEGDITAFFGLFFGFAGVATLVVTTMALRHILRLLGAGNVYAWVCVVHLAIAAVLMSVFRDILPLPVVGAIFALNILNYVLLDSVIAPTYQVLIKLVPQRNSDGTRMIMEGWVHARRRASWGGGYGAARPRFSHHGAVLRRPRRSQRADGHRRLAAQTQLHGGSRTSRARAKLRCR